MPLRGGLDVDAVRGLGELAWIVRALCEFGLSNLWVREIFVDGVGRLRRLRLLRARQQAEASQGRNDVKESHTHDRKPPVSIMKRSLLPSRVLRQSLAGGVASGSC